MIQGDRETVNHKLLIIRARNPEIYTESSMSLMTSDEEGQPPPNDPEVSQNTHSISCILIIVSSYMLHCIHCTLHIAF